MASDHRFETALPPCDGSPELLFRLVSQPPAGVPTAMPVLDLPLGSGAERFQLFTAPGLDVLRRTGAVELHVERTRISARWLGPGREYLLDLGFFGLAMPLWVERRGWPVLHASAVAVDGRAAGFLASAAGGKSSLAVAAMLAGAQLLSDDALALEPRPNGSWLAHPSVPQVRLWPADAERWRGSLDGLRRSHPAVAKLRVPVGDGWGRFARLAVPLSALYLPERVAGGPVVIEPIRGAQALLDLLRQSATPVVAAAAGLSRERFERLAKLAAQVPVRRLRVPAGSERLAEVAEHVLADLRAG